MNLMYFSFTRSESSSSIIATQILQTSFNLIEVEDVLNKNGHTNVIFSSLDYNDSDLRQIWSEFKMVRNGTTLKTCYWKYCHFANRTNVVSQIPFNLEIRNFEHTKENQSPQKQNSTTLFLMSTFNESHSDIYLNEITKYSSTIFYVIIVHKTFSTQIVTSCL